MAVARKPCDVCGSPAIRSRGSKYCWDCRQRILDKYNLIIEKAWILAVNFVKDEGAREDFMPGLS